MDEVLQERRTLADVLPGESNTFRNGCNYRFVREADGDYLEYGCFGVLINLLTGDKRLFYEWFRANSKDGRVPLRSFPEVARHFLEQIPCSECGGARFYNPPQTRRSE